MQACWSWLDLRLGRFLVFARRWSLLVRCVDSASFRCPCRWSSLHPPSPHCRMSPPPPLPVLSSLRPRRRPAADLSRDHRRPELVPPTALATERTRRNPPPGRPSHRRLEPAERRPPYHLTEEPGSGPGERPCGHPTAREDEETSPPPAPTGLRPAAPSGSGEGGGGVGKGPAAGEDLGFLPVTTRGREGGGDLFVRG
jgi:hypothetical protein